MGSYLHFWQCKLRIFYHLHGAEVKLLSAPAKVILASLIKARSSISNGWLVVRLGITMG